MFHYLMSNSNYPGILETDFVEWVDKAKITDENVKRTEVAIAFRSADVKLEKMDVGNNPDNALCRYEFLEVICRLANDKYIKPKINENYSEALQMILDLIFKTDKLGDQWQGFRKKLLYTTAVNDLLEPNISNLKKLYETYFEPRKRHMYLRDAHDLFIRRTGIFAKEPPVTFCFGMCKMTCINEMKEAEKSYNTLQFVEFLELIARVAHLRFSAEYAPEEVYK